MDSSVNHSVCKGMLESIMCHIMSRPGVTQESLLEHFKAVLQPVALLDLLQVPLALYSLTHSLIHSSPGAISSDL